MQWFMNMGIEVSLAQKVSKLFRRNAVSGVIPYIGIGAFFPMRNAKIVKISVHHTDQPAKNREAGIEYFLNIRILFEQVEKAVIPLIVPIEDALNILIQAEEICFFIDGLSSTDLKATRNKYSLAQYGEVSNIHSNSSK